MGPGHPAMRAVRRLLALWIGLLATRAWADEVAVPGGPAAIRRLFGLDSRCPPATLLLDLNEVLLSAGQEDAPWTKIETRRRAASFAEDLAQWQERFGKDARFKTVPAADWQRSRRALDWLGFTVQGDGSEFETTRRSDSTSIRRQSFLDVLGASTAAFLAELHAGGSATVRIEEETVPLPFGLAAWRETVSDPKLNAANAFLFFVRDTRASRLLVALHRLDPETRGELRSLPDGANGRLLGWRFLYEEALEPFSRYPEALVLRDGRFLLPGGAKADEIWTGTFGVSPSEPAAFLKVFYAKDRGKSAYVVDVLQNLPERDVREILFGPNPTATVEAERFRRLYESIDRASGNYARTHRDPYDFAHLAPFVRLFLDRGASLPLASPDETEFPRDEADLSRIVARQKPLLPDQTLPLLFQHDPGVGAEHPPAQRRFLVLSQILDEDPALSEPGLVVLLYRGLDRFLPAYSVLEALSPFRPELARRYLFTLDRLDRRKESREAEASAGLFEADVELLAELTQAGTISPAQAQTLLSSLLDTPLFAREDVSPGQGEAALYAWLSDRLFPAFRGDKLDSAAEPQSPDASLDRALVGSVGSAQIEWRGGRYRFDPAADEVSRRRAFLATQRLTSVADLAVLHQERHAALAAAASGDLAAMKAATADLSRDLGLAARKASPRGDDGTGDGRIARLEERARQAAAEIAAVPDAAGLSGVTAKFAALDDVLAERHLEALLGHVYAAGAGDPEDLYYQDPYLVRRHSFRTLERGGRRVRTAFSATALVEGEGGGFEIAGSLFGLTDVLGLLHADQLPYRSAAGVPSEAIRSALVAAIRRMRVSRLDDDSLAVVAASCRATIQLGRALSALPPKERLSVWDGLARDIVPRSRLALLASLEGDPTEEAISQYLSPTDAYRIGRRLLNEASPPGAPPPAPVTDGREAMARLEAHHGAKGSRRRLAEFGPRAAAYAGLPGLADLDMPAYERLAAYRYPEIFADRLYDLKIVVACRAVEERLPAAVLPVLLPLALDRMLSRLAMAYPYDWAATTRAAYAFSREDLERILDEAVAAGRLVRDDDSLVTEAAS